MKNQNNSAKKTKYRTIEVVIFPRVMGMSEKETRKHIIKVISKHQKHIREYCYILHDKDVYTEDDVQLLKEKADRQKSNINIVVGQVKPEHFHILIALKSPAYLSQIANWFGVGENMVDIVGGKDGYIQFAEYMVHENPTSIEAGKHQYERDEVVTNNINIWEEIDRRKDNLEKYNRELNINEQIILEVRRDGLTIEQAEEKYPLQFAQLEDKIRKARAWFLKHNAEMPKERRNIYIMGEARCGKTTLAKAIARTLIDPDNNLTDDEVFHIVGDNKVPFDNYDGQPVIIWDEWTATKFRKSFNRDTLKIFDPHPNKSVFNIKYGSVNLVNSINIISCIQPFEEFVNELMASYDIEGMHFDSEEKNQVYGRFPVYIDVEAALIELYTNGGDAVGVFDRYHLEMRLDANIREIVTKTENNLSIRRIILDKISRSILDRIEEIVACNEIVTDDDLKSLMSYGEIIFDKKLNDEPLLDEELPFE